MPRKARIDAPGAVHHIICRGIEGRDIFFDDTDRDRFVERLGRIVSESRTFCYGWALIPNHIHLLLKTGGVSISTVMLRLLTGYAVSFNRRHRRVGHLFQNRYKSILCQEDAYLLELVRYIHLNPLRAGLVDTLNQLDRHKYCGHSFLMGKKGSEWQDTQYVLKLFDNRASRARKRYREFIEKGVSMGRREDLTGGGLIRSAGGWSALNNLRKLKIHIKGDERILGSSDFVESVLAEQNERYERGHLLKMQGYDFDKLVERVSNAFELKAEQILGSSKQPRRVRARSILCFYAVKELQMSGTEVAERVNMSKSAVSRAAGRGEKIEADLRLNLLER
jgi:REP element-mobilizing transposase RayT